MITQYVQTQKSETHSYNKRKGLILSLRVIWNIKCFIHKLRGDESRYTSIIFCKEKQVTLVSNIEVDIITSCISTTMCKYKGNQTFDRLQALFPNKQNCEISVTVTQSTSQLTTKNLLIITFPVLRVSSHSNY